MHIVQEIKERKWRTAKSHIKDCPNDVQFDEFIKLFEATIDKPELRKLVTLKFYLRNTFGVRKWIDVCVSAWTQHDGWEFDLTGVVSRTPRGKPVCGVYQGMHFRIVGYVPSRKEAYRFDILCSG
jgi:hypothetical protein